MQIGWLSRTHDPHIASARYRIFLPALGLAHAGHEPCIYADPSRVAEDFDRLDCLIIGKLVDDKIHQVALAAARHGVPVVIDLCDNVFMPEYGGNRGNSYAMYFANCASFASAIVSTGPALTAALCERFERLPTIVEIPDPIESRRVVEDVLAESAHGCLRPKARSSGPAPSLEQRLRRLRKAAGLPWRATRRGARRLSGLVSAWVRTKRAATFPTEKAKLEAVIGATSEPALTPDARVRRKRLVWFGNAGAPYSEGGMLSILRVTHHLARVNTKIPIELVVVSNSIDMFRANIHPLPFPTVFHKWDVFGIFDRIASADVCILPQSQDEFTRTKSANRAVLALSLGVPVVASPLESLKPLEGLIGIGDWVANIESYLTDESRRRKDLDMAAEVIAGVYGLDVITRQWLDLLDKVVSGRRERPPMPRRKHKLTLKVFADHPQDLDLLLPVARAAKRSPAFSIEFLVTGRVAVRSPRIVRALERYRLPMRLVHHSHILEGKIQLVPPNAILLTASESTAGPHRVAHVATEQANAIGAATYTLQHGLENVGLNYIDGEFGARVGFASQSILIWGQTEDLPSTTLPSVRPRCISIGRTATQERSARLPKLPGEGPVVAVFENLHWKRYSDGYRDAFFEALLEAARACPDKRFLVKPHHDGRFSHRFATDLSTCPNVIFADPREPRWEPFTAPAFLSVASIAITTPSTVALDAALTGVPVAVVAGDLPVLKAYDPLPRLDTAADWVAFIADGAVEPGFALSAARDFVARSVVSGDASARLLGLLQERHVGVYSYVAAA